jgi:hypothetical protein
MLMQEVTSRRRRFQLNDGSVTVRRAGIMAGGASRGKSGQSSEIELVVSIEDQPVLEEVLAFKRPMDGCL